MPLRRGETVQTQTPSLPFLRGVIIYTILPALSPSAPLTHAQAGRFAAGAQIITGSTEFAPHKAPIKAVDGGEEQYERGHRHHLRARHSGAVDLMSAALPLIGYIYGCDTVRSSLSFRRP